MRQSLQHCAFVDLCGAPRGPCGIIAPKFHDTQCLRFLISKTIQLMFVGIRNWPIPKKELAKVKKARIPAVTVTVIAMVIDSLDCHQASPFSSKSPNKEHPPKSLLAKSKIETCLLWVLGGPSGVPQAGPGNSTGSLPQETKRRCMRKCS